MKTTVIQLENYDVVASIKDKLSWNSTERIILVWPKRGRILESELDLAFLQRAAESYGSRMVLVSHHPQIREWAEGLGIAVFASIAAAENWDWKTPIKKKVEKKKSQGYSSIVSKKPERVKNTHSQPVGRSQKVFASILSLAALIALFVVIVPRAEITVFPVTSQQQIEITIKASEVYSGASPSGNIPASKSYAEVSGELSQPSSGKTTIPTEKATGLVTFVNLTETSVNIPAGTLLMASGENGLLFQTMEDATLTAGINKSIEVSVEALSPGSEGNVGAGEIKIITGDLGEFLSVSNLTPFSGGGGIETPSPTENDYTILETQLLADLLQQGLISLKENRDQGIEIIEESLTVDEILLKERVTPIGESSDEAVLHVTLRVSALTYQKNDLEIIAALVLNSNLPDGYKLLNNDITLQQLEAISIDQLGQSTWKISASQTLVPDWDVEAVTNEITGMSVKKAKDYLGSLFDQSEPARIDLITDWWPWMPMLPTQIKIVDGVL